MKLIKFSEFDEEALLYDEEVIIIEWSDEEWRKLQNYERAEIDAEEEICLREYKARTKAQRRKTIRVKDLSKFKNRADKLKKRIEYKKGGVKVHRKKVRKKWQRVNKAKIANAQTVHGGETSKFTKTKPKHKRGGR